MKTLQIYSIVSFLFIGLIYSQDTLAKEPSKKKATTASEAPQMSTSFELPSGFEASEVQKKEIQDWFTKYDALTLKNDFEGMAAMALFPLHVVTHDSKGNGYSETWKKDDFMQVMKEAAANTPKNMSMTAQRIPYFLSFDLVVVVTKAGFHANGQTNTMKYVDILVREEGKWKFQTMAQAGWGDVLKARKKPAQ